MQSTSIYIFRKRVNFVTDTAMVSTPHFGPARPWFDLDGIPSRVNAFISCARYLYFNQGGTTYNLYVSQVAGQCVDVRVIYVLRLTTANLRSIKS